jgi:imidazolonepropionase-like amidohydrolase
MRVSRKRIAFVASLAIGIAGDAGAEVLAIVGGTLIDGRGGKPINHGIVVVEGERISAVGPASTAIPATAKVISAAGKWVIPGLMDANVHLVSDIFPLTLARHEGRYADLAIEAAQVTLRNGVTTVFDSWGPREPLIEARVAIASGRAVGSRIYLAGNMLGFGGPYSSDFFPQARETVFGGFADRVDALWEQGVGPALLWMPPNEVRQTLREYLQKGIDFVSYSVTAHRGDGLSFILFSPRVQQAIVDEAHRAGVIVQSRTTSAESLHLALTAGVDVLQYCDATVKQPIPAEIISDIVRRRTPCAILPNTSKALAWYAQAVQLPALKRYREVSDVNDRALLRAGAVILLSTDSGVVSADTAKSAMWAAMGEPAEESLMTLGEGHFNWFQAMEQKGMRPMDAVLAATRNIAQAFRVDADVGTLEPGKLADLVILDADPLASAANYRRIDLVMKAGRVIDRNALPVRRLLTAEQSHDE